MVESSSDNDKFKFSMGQEVTLCDVPDHVFIIKGRSEFTNSANRYYIGGNNELDSSISVPEGDIESISNTKTIPLTKEQLSQTLANMCYWTQNNYDDENGNVMMPLEAHCEAISYVVSCFLAQNTIGGESGIESDIVWTELERVRRNQDEWIEYFSSLVSELNGV